jgi:hypothetical protein
MKDPIVPWPSNMPTQLLRPDGRAVRVMRRRPDLNVVAYEYFVHDAVEKTYTPLDQWLIENRSRP